MLNRILKLQGLNLIFALSGVFVKFASTSWQIQGLFSLQTMFCVFAYIALMAVYAVFWQVVLKQISLSVAYLNKSFTLVWSILFAVLFFGEKLTIQNLIGILVIIIGIMLVNAHE